MRRSGRGRDGSPLGAVPLVLVALVPVACCAALPLLVGAGLSLGLGLALGGAAGGLLLVLALVLAAAYARRRRSPR